MLRNSRYPVSWFEDRVVCRRTYGMLSLLRRIARGSNLSLRPRFAIQLLAESKRWSVSSVLHCEVELITP